MILWLRPQYILALITSLFFCSSLVRGKTYEKFLCATEEGPHQFSCLDERALLTEISIRKVYRRTETCQPDDHADSLIDCQSIIDGSVCEGNQTCSIEISSQDYVQCADKTYLPTYFFIRYTCTQIHVMCDDKTPIRNTLHGYIVSPAFPHPMADYLKCSINIEADASMFIEITPIEINLQESMKCRSEYLEIFGYDSSTTDETQTHWKSYYTWCGADQLSSHHPVERGRYLIKSNSLYISLQTGTSKKSRFFKIRYKIVPSKVQSQYNSDGFAPGPKDQGDLSMISNSDSSTAIVPTTLTSVPSNFTDQQSSNGFLLKRTFRKEILIGSIVAIVLLGLASGIVVFLLLLFRRRRSSKNIPKKSSSSSAPSNVSSKSGLSKSPDKAPLLEQTTNNNNNNNGAKRKLVPERTVQITDVTVSRFKGNENATSSTSKAPLTAADSGIYGADLTEEAVPPIKCRTPSTTNELSKIEFLEKKQSLTSSIPIPATIPEITTSPVEISIAIPGKVTNQTIVESSTIIEQEDQTIQSAYPLLIDATTSENETNMANSINQEIRRVSVETSLLDVADQPMANFEDDSKNSITFNPLHVILKKDANKYYTTEYI